MTTSIAAAERRPGLHTLASSLVLPAFLLLFVPLLASALDDPFIIRIANRIVIFAIAATALNLALGCGGFVSLMHGALMGLGGYVVAIMAAHAPDGGQGLAWFGTAELAISGPAAMLIVGCIAAAAGFICIRTNGVYFIMISLSFNQMFYYFFVGWQRYGGDDGLQILSTLKIFGWPLSSHVAFYLTSVAVLVLVLTVVQFVRASRFGQVIRAISLNERRVVALGLSPLPYKLATFVISGVLTSVAGVLLAASQQFVSPFDLSWIKSGELVVMVILGGTALPWGPMAGAAAYLGFELLLSSITDYWQFCLGVGLVIVITFFRAGLSDLWLLCRFRILGNLR